MDANEIEKYFVPYLPQSINAAKDADISPHLSHKERQAGIDVNIDLELEIHLKDQNKVVAIPHRVLSHSDAQIQEKEVKEMFRMGVIRPSTSPFNSLTVLVDKPDGNKRHCNEYSYLNKFIADYNYQLLLIRDNLSRYHGFNLLSALDLRHGYCQVNLAEWCRHIIAFSTYFGKFEYFKVPMRIKTSPRFFQSVMHHVFEGMVNTSIEYYQDDILFKAVEFQDALFSLRQTFERIRTYGLKVRPEKCKFLHTNVKYLGFHVTPRQLIPPQDKMNAIRNVLPPN